jgi:hypothetical protein
MAFSFAWKKKWSNHCNRWIVANPEKTLRNRATLATVGNGRATVSAGNRWTGNSAKSATATVATVATVTTLPNPERNQGMSKATVATITLFGKVPLGP